ncbi:MAG TPA: 2-amino-4-hydroxy-6-hydroxymethyldihydropteridine diphosphokinase [Anaerolineales bacterium]|nr:2-amino-4-hydroxy-6-hydroxymethyldihydropteridine diphosphokinase [Anaerolineales bacterium]
MTHTVYLSLGSNLGDRTLNLQTAIAHLAPNVRVISQSSIYETEPWGYADQPTFLNQVVKASTSMEPIELLDFLKETEISVGRQETFRFGPRVIDLDILFYDDLVLDTSRLTIPHPRIAERAFVLIPMAEIDPNFRHPIFNKTILELKTSMKDGGIRLFLPAIHLPGEA